ncbi:MAG: TraX family protein [Bacillota bacterium]
MKPNIKKNDLLKIIAMVTMLVDHMGVLYFPEYQIFRTIGRIAFPIFAFYLAMGYAFTSSKKKYALRLFIFGVVSQIPYMFLNYNIEAHFLGYNVILLFTYALGMLFVFDQFTESIKKKKYFYSILYFTGLVFIVLFLEFLEVKFYGFYLSYGTYGLVLILLFYKLINKPIILIASFIVISFAFAYLQGVSILYEYYHYPYFDALFNFKLTWISIIEYKNGLSTLQGYFFQSRSIMGVLLIIILNKININVRINKYIAYYFYPIHIALLVLIKLAMTRL